MTITSPYELETEFRRLARQKYGDKQGKLSYCATEAIKEWCKKEK